MTPKSGEIPMFEFIHHLKSKAILKLNMVLAYLVGISFSASLSRRKAVKNSSKCSESTYKQTLLCAIKEQQTSSK